MFKIIICILAGLGAGLGTGFAGMSAAAVISPMLITFLHMDPYLAVGIALASDVLASAASAYTYGKNKNLDIKNGVIMMISVLCFTLVGRPIRMMIVGIPNVGKSSLINRLSGTRSAKVEDRPGVTRGKQWVSLEDGVELLDMPGVLWPKFEDKVAGERLAFIGSVKDQILDIEYLAMRLLDTLRPTYTAALAERYKLDAEAIAEMESYELLERIARKRGMLISGGEANTERAAIMLLDEFRSAAMGRITLERIPQ